MCPISGGNWNNSSNAGVWTLNCNNTRGNTNNNVGFRADSISPQGPMLGCSGIQGVAFRRVEDVQATAKSECHRHSGRHHAVLESLTL